MTLQKRHLEWTGRIVAAPRTNSSTGPAIAPLGARNPSLMVVSPPVEGGVRDYGEIIANACGGLHSTFIRGVPTTTAGPDRRANTILVQFSGYGYQSRGVPLALLRWIKAEKRKATKVGVFFHELFAFGPPWRSSFWLSPVQRYIAAELARVADFWITNRRASADWLIQNAGSKPHAVLPTASNVGELLDYRGNRDQSIVVFGSPELRAQTYARGGSAFLDWIDKEGLVLHDVGPPLADDRLRDSLLRRGARLHGHLSAEAVSGILSKASAGALAYPMAFAAKSGVLAAYCAHGVCPIIFSTAHRVSDDLVLNTHYAGDPTQLKVPHDLTAIGSAAWQWYQEHRINMHVQAVTTLSNNC